MKYRNFGTYLSEVIFVGWRPLTPNSFDDYPAEVQRRVVKVKPGLTGIGSLVFRNEEDVIGKAQLEKTGSKSMLSTSDHAIQGRA